MAFMEIKKVLSIIDLEYNRSRPTYSKNVNEITTSYDRTTNDFKNFPEHTVVIRKNLFSLTLEDLRGIKI